MIKISQFQKQRMHNGQIPALVGTWMFVGMFLSIQGIESFVATLMLMVCASITGVLLINRFSRSLSDPNIQKLSYLFLCKLCLCSVVVRYGWVVLLDPHSATFGYDPQRFYFNARTLIEGGFSSAITEAISVNYAGIVYWYAAQFAVVGQNPYIPIFTNGLLTLLAVLIMIEVAYHLRSRATSRDWYLGFSLVLPEVIWYDCLTARESVVMALCTIASVGVGYSLVSKRNPKILSFLALMLVGVIRTPILIPIVLSWGLLYCSIEKVSSKRRTLALLSLLIFCGIIFAAPKISVGLGSYEFDYLNLTKSVLERNDVLLDNLNWNQNSIGRLLIPNNGTQAVLYTIPRFVLILISPWPNLSSSWAGMLAGNWSEWQDLATGLTSLIYIFLLPNAIAALIDAIRKPGRRSALLFHISYWSLMLAVAGGNHFIEPRYRVMASLLFCACVWVSRDCSKQLIRSVQLAWAGVLISGALCYMGYKYV